MAICCFEEFISSYKAADFTLFCASSRKLSYGYMAQSCYQVPLMNDFKVYKV